jgi:hypothetical protein
MASTMDTLNNTQYTRVEGTSFFRSKKSQIGKVFKSFIRKWYVPSNVQYGYIFCISSEPINGSPYTDGECGVYYVGYSFKDPVEIIEEMEKDSNNQNEFSLEFSKRIWDPVGTNAMAHYVLDEHDTRIENERDFFKCKKSLLRQIFQYYEVDWYVVPFRP